MDVSIMLEQVAANGYRATALTPLALVAEAPTRDEAVQAIRSLVTEKISRAEFIQINVAEPPASNPWLTIAGTWRDNPDVDEVTENIQAYRREVDADAGRL